MAIIICPECKKSISDKAKACPICGASKPASWLWLKLLLGVPIGFFALVMIFVGPTSERESELNENRRKDKAVIKLCWEEQSKKSLHPETARFLAYACEKAEQDFRYKYKTDP